MMIQSIMASQGAIKDISLPANITWGGATSGNYTDIGASVNTIFTPTSETDSYNHHPHLIYFNNEVHLFYSTADLNEEHPGQYVRYQKSSDNGLTWSTPSTLLAPQDDRTKAITEDGRVCIPAVWVIVEGELYGIVDINDKSDSTGSNIRTGVGIIAVKVNSNGTFGTPVWIENVDGTETAPNPISGYPAYSFDSVLRIKVRDYLLQTKNLPTWYYSVPSSDPLYTRRNYGVDELTEPSTAELPNGGFIKLWRWLTANASIKIAQTSEYGSIWSEPFTTEIPDAPSRTKILKLYSNALGIIGNNDSTNRTPLFFAQSEDGFNVKASNIYNIDTETTGASYPGLYKGIGTQYPDAIQLPNSKILAAYSVNKEDMRIAIFEIPEIV